MQIQNGLTFLQKRNLKSDLWGDAPAYDGKGTEEVIDSFSAYGSYYVLEHDADETDYADYCNKLVAFGFTLYASKTSNGNRFATYTDGENIVNVSYIRYKDVDRYVTREVSYVAIAVDSVRNSALPCKCEAYQKITTVQVSMMNVLLSFVVRLEDGRFLIIDGGLKPAADRIYDALCSQNVRDGKPVVAAWMFSHPHCDHVDGFIHFLEAYGDAVEIQSVIHNFPGESTYVGKNYMEYHMQRVSDSITKVCMDIKRLMNEKKPDAKLIVAHAGQAFEYPGVKLEVLMTSENLYKKQMFDSNMSSVVYMLTMPTGKLLALGDAVEGAAKILRKIYEKDLQCDAVILAHHAVNGGDEELYHHTKAKAAIWPNVLENIFGERNLFCHYTNHFNYNAVKHNFIMSKDDPIMILHDGMTAEELAHFAPRYEIPKTEVMCFENRKKPKNELHTDRLNEGYGDVPRYYGKGEETENLSINSEEKTYTVTIRNTTPYWFEYYRNSLKRDGYKQISESKTDDYHSVTYADPKNEVRVCFNDGVLEILVGRAGVNTLEY